MPRERFGGGGVSVWRSLLARALRQNHGIRWAPPESSGSPVASLYQICYSQATWSQVEHGFLRLDNRANRRPDWREYHPIRTFLQEQPLEEERIYGFFSPKFRGKTLIAPQEAFAFIEEHRDCDVVLFSPYVDLHAFFLNAFLQGDYFHPGLLAVSQAFTEATGRNVDLAALVMDFRRSAFCNYFAAKPRFWRAWLDVNEKLYALAQRSDTLGQQLNAQARHTQGETVQYKVFVQERTVDLLLGTEPHWRVAAFDRSAMSTIEPFCNDMELIVQANGLKAAYVDSGDKRYLQAYNRMLEGCGLPPGELPAAEARRIALAGEPARDEAHASG
jgi:hypothetical protein